MATGASEAETFWTDFLRSLARLGLRSVKPVIAGAHQGLKAAVRRVLHASSPRCRVHFRRNALAHAGKGYRRLVPAWIDTTFAEAGAKWAKRPWRTVADQFRASVPEFAGLMDAAEEDALAFMAFPREHRAKNHNTNPPERVNCEIKRRADVVGIFPDEAAFTRLLGAILPEQNDEWAMQRRYISLETLAPISDAPNVSLPVVET